MTRRPCPTCPWRKSTPRGGFPGGIIDAAELRRMAGGDSIRAMQCHCTPDDDPQICVGFALQVGMASTGFRLAVRFGLVDSGSLETDEDLHSLLGVLAAHGGVPS